MPTLKIPGVYVQEIPTLPPGVAEVESAIPAFIGYTYTTKFNDNDLKMNPIKVQSMLEFVRYFGESSPFTINGVTDNLAYSEQNATVVNHFYLYDSLQLYFLNGGGPCYIVSVGQYDEASTSDAPYIQGLDALDLFDEPTLYLLPDAVLLPDPALAKVQQYALRKCGDLMDRFSILDVKKNTDPLNTLRAVTTFRNTIGMSYLSYGAAYTPWLSSTLEKRITVSSIANIFDTLNKLPLSLKNAEVNGVIIGDNITNYQTVLADLNTIAASGPLKAVVTAYESGITAYVDGTNPANPFATGEIFDAVIDFDNDDDKNINSTEVKSFWVGNLKDKIAFWEAQYTAETSVGTPEEQEAARSNFLSAVLNSSDFERFKDVSKYTTSGLKKVIETYETFLIDNVPFYASLLKILNNKLTEIPPSGAIAGLYCKTDSEKGVWKAPANISVSAVNGVSQLFSNADLADLNVDPIAGKSINVIRPITGYGTMVMGARTLAGNDSEWRYIPVRRLFIFIEENLKKATAWAVFEPNDRLLWLKVRTQIENYLFELWRQGALAGAKPEHAYQVNCGLNSTMTPQDVLEGKLIVEIKLAAVRPAEFILLKFSHQLQKS